MADTTAGTVRCCAMQGAACKDKLRFLARRPSTSGPSNVGQPTVPTLTPALRAVRGGRTRAVGSYWCCRRHGLRLLFLLAITVHLLLAWLLRLLRLLLLLLRR